MKLTVLGKNSYLWLLFGILSIYCFGGVKSFGQTIREPASWDDLSIQLLTVGLGETIEARYGHTFIRVFNHKTNEDHNINWGMFDFSDPLLPLNFFLGRLRYWAEDFPLNRLLYQYHKYEKRGVIADTINLTNKQKEVFVAKINENLKKENKYFWYQYFYKNCSTFPRDYLNEILGGKIFEILSKENSGKDFRFYVRDNLNRPPPVSLFLDIVMNSNLELKLSKWVEMFYPSKLREYLYRVPAFDDQGRPIEGMKLLSNKKILVNYPDVPKDSWTLQIWILLWSVLAMILILFSLHEKSGDSRFWKHISSIMSYLYIVPWSFFSGLLGSVMLISWCFSDHLDLHHNSNLMIFWFVDFIYIAFPFLIFRPFIYKKPISQRVFFMYLSLGRLHILAAFLWYLGNLSGFIEQNSSWVMVYTAPMGLLFWLLLEVIQKQRLKKG